MNAPSLRALLQKPPRASIAAPLTTAEATSHTDEYEAYANGRIGHQPQLTVVFRKANGSVCAFSYSYLYGIESDDPANGFTLDFLHTKVNVTGQRLDDLFRLVCAHRVVEIRELAQSEQMETPNGEPIVEQIVFK